jgi:hypothetical protein
MAMMLDPFYAASRNSPKQCMSSMPLIGGSVDRNRKTKQLKD